MQKPWRTLRRYAQLAILCLILVDFLGGEGPAPNSLGFRLDRASGGFDFDFVTWHIEALLEKLAYGLLAPQRFMSDEAQAQFVLDHLEDIGDSRRLRRKIETIYIDPDIDDPALVAAAETEELASLRERLKRASPVAEAIIAEQVSSVLRDSGLGVLGQVLPPVSGTITSLPHVMIVSPRERIEVIYQRTLIEGMDVAQMAALESRVETEITEVSIYITAIGGMALYPAMLLESTSIDRLADVMAHEWAHHYFMFGPLGWSYFGSSEARTINETSATLLGNWAGQEVIRRFYAPLLQRGKRLPDPLKQEPPPEETGELIASGEDEFDYYATMRETRLTVDELLEAGQIEQAEAYMEAQRQRFVAEGYRLRRLNQAYFSFHGSYATMTIGGGAVTAGRNPLGPSVRHIWALYENPIHFLRRISRVTTLEELYAFIAPLESTP